MRRDLQSGAASMRAVLCVRIYKVAIDVCWPVSLPSTATAPPSSNSPLPLPIANPDRAPTSSSPRNQRTMFPASNNEHKYPAGHPQYPHFVIVSSPLSQGPDLQAHGNDGGATDGTFIIQTHENFIGGGERKTRVIPCSPCQKRRKKVSIETTTTPVSRLR